MPLFKAFSCVLVLLSCFVGSIQRVEAVAADTTCAQSQDRSDADADDNDTITLLLISLNSCNTSFRGKFFDGFFAGETLPIILLLNSNNDGTPVWLNNFEIQFHSSITNIIINGAAFGGGRFQNHTNSPLTSATDFTVQYDYAGSTYHFTTTVDPINHTIGGFTIQAGAAAQNTVSSSSTPTAATTQERVRSFTRTRASHILNNQPGLTGFVTGSNLGGGGPLGTLNFSGNEGSQVLGFSTSRSRVLARTGGGAAGGGHLLAVMPAKDDEALKAQAAIEQGLGLDETDAAPEPFAYRAGTWDVWTQVYGARSTAGSSESTLFVGYAGAHLFVRDNLLIGMLGQIDWADEENETSNSASDGVGWMAGPYVAGRVGQHPLFYEARIAYGRSDNSISPNGTYSDDFGTERFQVAGKVSGSFETHGFSVQPQAGFSWYVEKQEGYTDSNGAAIAEQTASLGEIRFGPAVERLFAVSSGDILLTPRAGVSGVWNFNINASDATQGTVLGDDRLRARVDLGLNARLAVRGVGVTSAGFYDGIGVNNYESWGGRLRVNVPF